MLSISTGPGRSSRAKLGQRLWRSEGALFGSGFTAQIVLTLNGKRDKFVRIPPKFVRIPPSLNGLRFKTPSYAVPLPILSSMSFVELQRGRTCHMTASGHDVAARPYLRDVMGADAVLGPPPSSPKVLLGIRSCAATWSPLTLLSAPAAWLHERVSVLYYIAQGESTRRVQKMRSSSH